MIENYGDMEIRTLAFDTNSVVMKIFDPESLNFHAINFVEVEYFFLSSHHMQNVIDRATIMQGRSKHPLGVTKHLLEKKVNIDQIDRELTTFFLELISGESCIIICSKLEFL